MLHNDISLRDSILLHDNVKDVSLKDIKRRVNDYLLNDVSSPIYYQNIVYNSMVRPKITKTKRLFDVLNILPFDASKTSFFFSFDNWKLSGTP